MTPEDLRQALHGIVAITVTPMNPDGSIDAPAFRKHLRAIVDHGINRQNGTIVVTGSTGESGALSADERQQAWEMALDEVGDDLPVIAGCNHSNIREVQELLCRAERAGVAGGMVLSPYYYVPTADVVVDFYRQAAESTGLGLLLYNNTEVTHYDIPVEVLERVVEEAPRVVGIKECTPNFVKMERTARTLGDKIAVVNGHGEFLEPYAAIAGTVGFISSTSNFAPGIAVEIWEARSRGDYEAAAAARKRLTPYLDLAVDLARVGGEPKVLSLLKYLSHRVHGIGTACRLPLQPLSKSEMSRADAVLSQIGLV